MSWVFTRGWIFLSFVLIGKNTTVFLPTRPDTSWFYYARHWPWKTNLVVKIPRVSNPAIRFRGYPKSRNGNQKFIHSWSDFALQRNHLCVFQRDVGETGRSTYTGRRRSKSERQRDSKMDPQEEIIQKPNPRQIIIIKLNIGLKNTLRMLETVQRFWVTFFETAKTFVKLNSKQ
jgi:hypothetical protein